MEPPLPVHVCGSRRGQGPASQECGWSMGAATALERGLFPCASPSPQREVQKVSKKVERRVTS